MRNNVSSTTEEEDCITYKKKVRTNIYFLVIREKEGIRVVRSVTKNVTKTMSQY